MKPRHTAAAVLIVFSCLLCFTGCGRRDRFLKEALSDEEQASGQSPEPADREEAAVTPTVTEAETQPAADPSDPSGTLGTSDPSGTLVTSDPAGASEAPTSVRIYVDVGGAVLCPGVYLLPEDARVFQAIEAAGGFSPEAASWSLNKARPLSDGEHLYILTEDEAAARAIIPEDMGASVPEGTGIEEISSGPEENGKVNINTANAEELCSLTGIGQAKAQAILSYREKNGSFAAPEELMNVPGIKGGTYEAIKDKISIR